MRESRGKARASMQGHSHNAYEGISQGAGPVVRFDVRGMPMATLRSTLLAAPRDSLVAQWVRRFDARRTAAAQKSSQSSRKRKAGVALLGDSKPAKDGRYHHALLQTDEPLFVDVNPKWMAIILDYLAHGVVTSTRLNRETLTGVGAAAEYLGLHELACECDLRVADAEIEATDENERIDVVVATVDSFRAHANALDHFALWGAHVTKNMLHFQVLPRHTLLTVRRMVSRALHGRRSARASRPASRVGSHNDDDDDDNSDIYSYDCYNFTNWECGTVRPSCLAPVTVESTAADLNRVLRGRLILYVHERSSVQEQRPSDTGTAGRDASLWTFDRSYDSNEYVLVFVKLWDSAAQTLEGRGALVVCANRPLASLLPQLCACAGVTLVDYARARSHESQEGAPSEASGDSHPMLPNVRVYMEEDADTVTWIDPRQTLDECSPWPFQNGEILWVEHAQLAPQEVASRSPTDGNRPVVDRFSPKLDPRTASSIIVPPHMSTRG